MDEDEETSSKGGVSHDVDTRERKVESWAVRRRENVRGRRTVVRVVDARIECGRGEEEEEG